MNPGGEEVDHRFPAEFTVGDDIDAGRLLVHDGGADCGIVCFDHVCLCQCALCAEVADGSQPVGKRVAADDGGGEER